MVGYAITRAATTSLTPSTTAAAAGICKVDQGATLSSITLYYFSIGPHANSADETYAVRLKRQTTAGTWTNAQTPAPLDNHTGACTATAATVSSAAGTAAAILGEFNYHMRGGYAWTAIPGGEMNVLLAAAAGIILEYTFAQGTSVQDPTFHFKE